MHHFRVLPASIVIHACSIFMVVVNPLALPSSIRIGGLFELEHSEQEEAFKYAIEKINESRDLLPFTKLEYDIQEAQSDDSFGVSKKVCRQLKEGIAAVFGPMSSSSAAHVQSICDAMDIPHLETRWNFHDSTPIEQNYFSINLFPYYRTLGAAYVDVIQYWKWTSFTVLYQTNEGLIRLQELLKSPALYDVKVSVRRLDYIMTADGVDYRPILKDVEKRGETRFVLDCDYDTVYTVLNQALSINMMSQYYHYLITTLDLELMSLDGFKHGGANITAFRLFDRSNENVLSVMDDWTLLEEQTGVSPLENNKGFKNASYPQMTTETALMYDAVYVFAHALDDLSHAIEGIQPEPLSCNRAQSWVHGSSLMNYLKMTEVEGLTGKVVYNTDGVRTDFTLDLVEMTLSGIDKVGHWRPGPKALADRINITKNYEEVKQEVAESLKNKSLKVTSIIEAPYIMLVNDSTAKGNDRYEGFCVDLLRAIAERLNFSYTIHLVEDGQYGAPTENGEWSGMVQELRDKKADLAVASLTISYRREQVIDFTKPFMSLGISILFKRPEKKNPSLFSFLSPLSFDIWICMLAAYLVVSFVLFVLARFSPYEWYNPHPCDQDSDLVENQFSLLNSLWFTIGSLMQQGSSEVAPRAVSTRLVSGIWWFFTLIMISSYTANLAAFLTVERMTTPIENADDLSKQSVIKYGTVYGGSTMTFFESSTIDTYSRMWSTMEATSGSTTDSVFVNSTPAGIARVMKGNYAFLMESTMIQYNTQRNCDLMQIGGELDSKGYGIGTPINSLYRDLISDAILKLQEDQKVQELYNKWWKQKGAQGCDADASKGKSDANALAIDNVGGIFVVLLGGLVLSLFVVLAEFIWKSKKNAEDHRWKKSLCQEIGEEFRYAVSCFNSSTKTLKKKPAERPASMPPQMDYYHDGNGSTLMPLTGGLVPSYQLAKKDYT